MLNYYRAFIRLRKTNPALRGGDFASLNEEDPNVLSFIRRATDGTTVVVVLNCTPDPQAIAIHGMARGRASVLLSSFAAEGSPVDLGALKLPAYGALVATLGRP